MDKKYLYKITKTDLDEFIKESKKRWNYSPEDLPFIIIPSDARVEDVETCKTHTEEIGTNKLGYYKNLEIYQTPKEFLNKGQVVLSFRSEPPSYGTIMPMFNKREERI